MYNFFVCETHTPTKCALHRVPCLSLGRSITETFMKSKTLLNRSVFSAKVFVSWPYILTNKQFHKKKSLQIRLDLQVSLDATFSQAKKGSHRLRTALRRTWFWWSPRATRTWCPSRKSSSCSSPTSCSFASRWSMAWASTTSSTAHYSRSVVSAARHVNFIL